MKLSDLKINPNNPRIIKDARFKKLCNSVRNFPKMMALRPIVIDRANGNLILGGNMRFLALKTLKFTEIPDKWIRDAAELTEEEKRRFIIEDNMPFGEWDMDILANSFDTSDLIEWGFDEKELGISPEDPHDAEPQIDRAEELNKKWHVKTGNLWQIGGHRLLCGDSTRAEDVERVMGGKKADMVFTDPPYGINLDTKMSERPGKKDEWEYKPKHYDRVIGDDIDYDPTPIFNAWGYCSEIFLWGADYYAEMIPARKQGSWLVWDKREGIEDISFSLSSFELCWSKNKHSREIIRKRWMGLMGTETQDIRSRVHPTQKPIEIFNWIIGKYLKQGELVVDPFLGSGTTMVSAENLKRRCFGIEISESYCAVILERMKEAFGIMGTLIQYDGHQRPPAHGKDGKE